MQPDAFFVSAHMRVNQPEEPALGPIAFAPFRVRADDPADERLGHDKIKAHANAGAIGHAALQMIAERYRWNDNRLRPDGRLAPPHACLKSIEQRIEIPVRHHLDPVVGGGVCFSVRAFLQSKSGPGCGPRSIDDRSPLEQQGS